MSSQYFPPYRGTNNNIKVQLDLTNYATKDDIKNITHVDVSNYATKTNLAALKSEVDKIDIDKLKTVPADLAKLSNVKNNVVKKTNYNTKVTSIEIQIAGVTKNTLDNLADITKLKAVDTSNFVAKTKFTADINVLNNKRDAVEEKIPDVSGLATKSSLTTYLQTTTFNSKVTEVENKIKVNDTLAKSVGTKITSIETNLNGFKKSDLTSYAKKADVAADITTIKNNYVTNASLSNQLNDLKSQHITDEVKKVEDKVNENKKEIIFVRGFFSYEYHSDLVYDCKLNLIKTDFYGILEWKPKNIYDPSNKNVLNSVQNIKNIEPNIKNDGKRLHVFLVVTILNKILQLFQIT